MKHAIVTGGSGFIGSHLVDRLQRDGWRVTVLDIAVAPEPNIWFDVTSSSPSALPTDQPVDVIVHLAAKAGVRRSFAEHEAYIRTNVIGTQRMLDLAVVLGVKRFVFASSSSVYGTNPNTPWKESESLRPASPYAATKIDGEVMGRVYVQNFGLRFTALRFFTVYGPNQRKDLAIRTFAERMLAGQPITVFGDGSMARDYTYIDDCVEGIVRAMSYDGPKYDVFNIGSGRAITLLEMVHALEDAIGVRASIEQKAQPMGDVPRTHAYLAHASHFLGWEPKTSFDEGLSRFVGWLKGQQVGVAA